MTYRYLILCGGNSQRSFIFQESLLDLLSCSEFFLTLKKLSKRGTRSNNISYILEISYLLMYFLRIKARNYKKEKGIILKNTLHTE